ncbi:MAG: hypothetical protein V3T31_02635, partial [candidate division Zixibacteria bacterium]
ALLIAVFKLTLAASRSKDIATRVLGSGMCGGTIAFWICGIVNVPLSGSSGLLYWALAGVICGLTHAEGKEADSSDSPTNHKAELA